MKPLHEPQASQTARSQPVDQQRPARKKPYTAPELKKHGTIQQIVQNSTFLVSEDMVLGFDPPES
jgi:hypothetical protein